MEQEHSSLQKPALVQTQRVVLGRDGGGPGAVEVDVLPLAVAAVPDAGLL